MSATELTPGLVIQGFTPPLKLSDFKLIAFDMDSTLINIECIDEIADAAGRKAEVAAITEATMRGEIADFKESLRRRVALLKGVPVASMHEVYERRLQLNPGAETLVTTCKAAGLKVLLVSGGFTFFTDRIRDRLQIDYTRSNVLEEHNGLLTGQLVHQAWGDICDGIEKRTMLLATCQQLGIEPHQAIAMGDGSNDLPMMAVAGLSVAYHAKPVVREKAMVAINSGGLDRLLEVLTHAPAPAQEPDIDLSVLDRLVEYDAAKFSKFAQLFKSSISAVLIDIDQAITQADLATLAAMGHRAKSTAFSIGASKFARQCQQLEQSARANKLEASLALAQELRPLFNQVASAIDQRLGA